VSAKLTKRNPDKVTKLKERNFNVNKAAAFCLFTD